MSDQAAAQVLVSKTEVTDDVRRFMTQCSHESPWLALDLQGFPRIAPLEYDPHRMPPVMILSCDDDQLIRPRDVTESARLYQPDVHWWFTYVDVRRWSQKRFSLNRISVKAGT